MGITVYNRYKESHYGDNVYDISRSSIFGNPYTHMKEKKTKASFLVPSRDEAIALYRDYFHEMYSSVDWFKNEVDKIYEKYKNGEEIFLSCTCKPLPCHGDVIKEFLVSRLVKEKISDLLKNKKMGNGHFTK